MTSEEQAAHTAAQKATEASRAADDAMTKAVVARDAQRAADQKAAAEAALKLPVIIHGRAGGVFSIDGPGLGNDSVLFIGGRVIPLTRSDDRSIRGILPPDIQGAVRLQTSVGDRHGVFPVPKVEVTTTTTMVTKETVPVKQ